MKQQIERLYQNRNFFDSQARRGIETYLPYFIRFWYHWMNTQLKSKNHRDQLFWSERLSHNSVIFIQRACDRLDFEERRKKIRAAHVKFLEVKP